MKAHGRRYWEGDVLLVVVGVLLAMGSIGAGALLAQVPRSKAEVMPADAEKVSPGGASFKVPAGWSLETAKNLEVLTPPETDTHVAIFDAGAAADAKSAVTAAWAALKGGQTHSLKIVTPRPAREGWDDRQVFEYETSPNERAVIEALALRTGATWTVLLIDGTDPTVERPKGI